MKYDIIRMAQEAGLRNAFLLHMYGKEDALCDSEIEKLRQLERFAALVAAAEREACAKVCEANVWSKPVAWWREATKSDVSVEAGLQCAAAIRARGQDPMPLFDDWPGGFK